MIDPHVHLRDWNQREKESIRHGLSVARMAGIDAVFDMPNTDPPLVNRQTIIKRIEEGKKEAGKTGSEYHVYAGLTNDAEQIKSAVNLYKELYPDLVALKMFLSHSTGNMGIVEKEEQRKVIRALVREDYRGVLAVHAEKESLNESAKEELEDYSSHSLARPAESEIRAVKDIIEIVRDESFKGHLHICHISTRKAAELVIAAKKEGLSVSMGATPHHALLRAEDAKDKTRFLKMNPPLRAEEDRAYIYNALKSGIIDNVESDHAPHTLEDKKKGACGIPCFSGMLLLLKKLESDGVDKNLLESLFGGNVIKIYGLKDRAISLPDVSEALFNEVQDSYPVRPFKWI